MPGDSDWIKLQLWKNSHLYIGMYGSSDTELSRCLYLLLSLCKSSSYLVEHRCLDIL